MAPATEGITVVRWLHHRERTTDGVVEWYENLDYGRSRRPRPQWIALDEESVTNLARCARLEFRGDWLKDDPARPFAVRIHYDMQGERIQTFDGPSVRRLYGRLREWTVPDRKAR
ncbi:hypothetical protein [Sphaerobacter sp.]|uniref:hypothetical protein n=1 Tax=Sphaerobacter sp. TaxID=2099654 RepID=UPI001D82AA1D|nr:hypothetical protein [Sphaerobacter sp.]MBX5443908.1 hypothetical protein [Sphaerobacter sp.]